MKPEQTHDTAPMADLDDATDPGEAPEKASQEATPGHRSVAAPSDRTNPDPLDVERLILSLERTPRPPAPIPEVRASSDGGRFVAYRATGRPAQPQLEQEARRRALRELSVLVNATPVPPESDARSAPTARLARAPRAIGAKTVWGVGVAVVSVAGLVFLIVWSNTRPSDAGVPVALVATAHPQPPSSAPASVALSPLPPPEQLPNDQALEAAEARSTPTATAPPVTQTPPVARPASAAPAPVPVRAPPPRTPAPTALPGAAPPEPAPPTKAAFDRW